MIRLIHANVAYGDFKSPYQRVLALFFPRVHRRAHEPGRVVLSDVTLQLTHGAALAVLGDADALFRLIAGEVSCSEGTAEIRGHVVRVDGGEALLPFLSGRGNARLFARLYGCNRQEVSELLAAVEASAAFGDRFTVPVKRYCAEERALLSLSIALALHPDTLLIDGGLSALSPARLSALLSRLRAELLSGMCLLLHAPQEIASLVCRRAVWIESGRVRRLGSFAEVAAARRIARCQKRLTVCTPKSAFVGVAKKCPAHEAAPRPPHAAGLLSFH